jgi:hypothetical protein
MKTIDDFEIEKIRYNFLLYKEKIKVATKFVKKRIKNKKIEKKIIYHNKTC